MINPAIEFEIYSIYIKMPKIYVLIDPINNNIRYVGKTKQSNINKRLMGHIRMSKKQNKTKKERWISNLLKRGFKPDIKIIEECNNDEWEKREMFWIEYYSRIYNLTNGTIGGDGIRDAHGQKNGMYGKKHSKESKDKMRIKAHERIGIKNSRSRKIYQYDINGNFMKEWKYCKEVLNEYNLSTGNLSSAAKNNQHYIDSGYSGMLKVVSRFIFTFEKIEKIEKINLHRNAIRFLK